MLASGSRDRSILCHDVRVARSVIKKFEGHKQEVCGLKWSFSPGLLASGGNDNKLLIWDFASAEATANLPLHTYSEHQAAVKAIAWSPHSLGVVASGGGTADRRIKMWNTQLGTSVSTKSLDTGSQVCNLVWSKTSNAMASTHGYSLNQIVVWDLPSMEKVLPT
eukprot:GHVN01050967.1.p1 GENE.GHVN01050967.1~~GHVN01050967.1.p1  ORF type:complete len:164 (+),score=19.84 GHVN01050967.1:633-1124(+)